MKTLTVRQPYASFIAAGIKDIENRSWSTDYRGKILIHSSNSFDCEIFDKNLPIKLWHEFNKKVSMQGVLTKPSDIIAIVDDVLTLKDESYRKEFDLLKKEIALQLDHGKTYFNESAIIGSVEIADVIIDSRSIWSDSGYFHWILKNPVMFKYPTTNIKGQLRLWNYNGMIDETPA